MPLKMPGNVGEITIQDASVNYSQLFAVASSTTSLITEPLQTIGMPRITWVVRQRLTGAPPAGVPLTFVVEAAFRRGPTVGGSRTLVWEPVTPAISTVPGSVVSDEITLTCQAIRLSFTSEDGETASLNVHLSASA